jgi:hypothetical protein
LAFAVCTKFFMSRFITFIVTVGLLAAGAAASAQVRTRDIFARVTDASTAVLPSVTAILEGPVSRRPATAVTGETGTYQFPRLTVGTYTVKGELQGFTTPITEGVLVELGLNLQVNAERGVAGVEETVTVKGESPIVDTRHRGTRATFTQEMLQSTPPRPDPWAALEQIPSISTDGQNVGGTASGQHSG